MTIPLYVTTDKQPDRPARLHQWRDLPQIDGFDAANWLRIGCASDMPDAELPNPTAFSGIDAVVVDRLDPRGWFWERAALPLCVALGIPESGIWLRPAAVAALSASAIPLDPEHDLLAELGSSGLSHGGRGCDKLAGCGFRHRSPLTGPRSPRVGASRLQWLRGVTPAACLTAIHNPVEGVAVLAGVLLLNDLLDDSHSQSQSIEGQGGGNGDYWHAIMHRREPDFGNAKYWFRRVGDHPVMRDLPRVAESIAADLSSESVNACLARLPQRGWDAFAFVDLCSELDSARHPPDELLEFAERLQWAEMLLLLAHSCRQATA